VVAVVADEPPSGDKLVGVEEVAAVVTGLVDEIALGWVVLDLAAVLLVESATGAAT
jgi:hypothetical protein